MSKRPQPVTLRARALNTSTATATQEEGVVTVEEQLADPAAAQKQKFIRDGFSMPADDYALFELITDRMLGLKVVVTKSQLIRAGLRALDSMTDQDLQAVIGSVERGKPGRKTG